MCEYLSTTVLVDDSDFSQRLETLILPETPGKYFALRRHYRL